jgi:hypothetical protein
MVDGHNKDRLRKAFEELLQSEWEPPDPGAPIPDPVDRFLHLPAHTRRRLAGMSQTDWDDIDKILLGWRRTSTVAWFFKWFTTIVVGGFIATWALGEKLLDIFKTFRGGR